MDKEFLDALQYYLMATNKVMATLADSVYINGTSNNQFQKFQAADTKLHSEIDRIKARLAAPPAQPPVAAAP